MGVRSRGERLARCPDRYRSRGLSDREAGRPGRNERRLPGRAGAAEATRCLEAPRTRARRRHPLPRAFPAGVRARSKPRPPERHPDLRRGRDRRDPLHRDALRRRARPQTTDPGGRQARARTGAADPAAGRRARSTTPHSTASSTATSNRETSCWQPTGPSISPTSGSPAASTKEPA